LGSGFCGELRFFRTALYQWTKLCERAEVKCEIHQLRHTAATELVNSGVGVGTVRQLLGHRNLQTTQRYAELFGQAGYNYASSSTVRQELDAFARRKTRTR